MTAITVTKSSRCPFSHEDADEMHMNDVHLGVTDEQPHVNDDQPNVNDHLNLQIIIDKHQDATGQVWYLVAWEIGSGVQATWETAENLAANEIAEFEALDQFFEIDEASSDAAFMEVPHDDEGGEKELVTYLDVWGGVPTINVDFRPVVWDHDSVQYEPFEGIPPKGQSMVSPTSLQPSKRKLAQVSGVE